MEPGLLWSLHADSGSPSQPTRKGLYWSIEMETFPVRQKDLDDGAERAKASHPNSIGCGLYHAERIYIFLAASE